MSRVPASGAQPGSLVKGKPPTPIQYSTPSRMRNGVWERDTPIALTVFSQSENKKDTGIEQVKSRLKTLKQEDGRLSVSELEITPVTFNEKGHVRTVRGVQAGPRCVTVTFHDPATIALLKTEVEQTMKQAGGQKFFGMPFRVTFRPSPRVLPIDHPATLVALGQGGVPADLLKNELMYWVGQYNGYYKMTETLLDIRPGVKVGTLHGNAFAVPSSMGLAKWMTAQKPLSGDPWEFAYHANAVALAASACLLAKAKEEERDGQLLQIKDAIDGLSAAFGKLQVRVEHVSSNVNRMVNNFCTFARDLYGNMRQFFAQARHAVDCDAEVTAETLRMVGTEMEIRSIQREVDFSQRVVAALPSDSPLVAELKERIAVAKQQKSKLLETVKGIHGTLSMLEKQRNSKISLNDHTGLGLTMPTTQMSESLAFGSSSAVGTADGGVAGALAGGAARAASATSTTQLPSPPLAEPGQPPAQLPAVDLTTRSPSRDEPSPLPGSPIKKHRSA
ncbi:hypothetical protein A1Q1_05759 [Trichosporon asahii var. asahii CBS 2479]|uniref:Uncharacterized protein n=1 Tax=Trichosporon asahii var. asahii (strain ATCC 90039 / CBS 2479 / JCM 2466 / KCTC 7840 / NBRC 103889/ NCYC 2677 / UAMH 7654) TaxID=1186058 RepID=J5SIU0_TRIAS|nr:hypothetical protein A1Q1_05759 [Trichosporon asahii var. asahii CBS 2479]EJT45846.1 hypothetical protein A1Q1_05759 [Trichosporon asahii var. asahii CBS 2479]